MHGGRQNLRERFGLDSALELQFERHYQRFFMPTIRGAEEGSKKRYAGLTVLPDGTEEIVYKGLETVRTDWTPLAQQFQQELYKRIFKQQPYQDYVRDYVRDTLDGKLDEQLVYRKRLRRSLGDYERNVPPHVRAARVADEFNRRQGRPSAIPERRLDQLCDDSRGPRATGNAALRDRLRTLFDAAVATRRGCNPAALAR